MLALANGSKKFSFTQAMVSSPFLPLPAKYLVKPTKSWADGGIPNKSNGFVSPGFGIELATPIVTHLSSNIFLRSMLV